MIWPFRKTCRCAEFERENERLRAEVSDADDARLGETQHRVAAEQALAAIRTAANDEGLAKIAAEAAEQIADIYARGGTAVKTRDLAVSSVVFQVVRMATVGERHWNAGGVIRKGGAN